MKRLLKASRRPMAAFLAIFVVALLLPTRANAVAEELKVVGKLPVVLPADADPAYTVNGSLILNPVKRRAYQLFQLKDLSFIIRSFDLDSLKQIGEKRHRFLLNPAFGAGSGEFVHALDQANGRLFFPYLRAGNWSGVITVDGESLDVVKDSTRANASASPTSSANCGVSTSLNCVPLPVGASPAIRGMSFVSPEILGGRAKLLMLLNEPAAPGTERNYNIVWVSQWDAETGSQDFIYRVAACSSFTLPSDPLSKFQLSLFQSPSGAGIYVGCNAPGGAGQAVRLLSDSTGRPQAEEAYPGPLRVVDVLSDPGSDRLIFRSVSEEGESYWVFDGRSSSYAGVVGATVNSVQTAAGVDPDTGRFYLLAPPNSAGRQKDAGGLLLVDGRRSPVPQALRFAEFAAGGQAAIRVDPEVEGTRPRRVFVRPAGTFEYQVIRDTVPLSSDPRASDLDRFTVDTDEVAGRTSANYTGTGAAFGVRALFIGGLEGVPPQTVDASGFRPSRALPTWVGSPCGRSDRELVIGGVRKSALSNDLASATSTAVDADAGTKTDEQAPGGRCYPRPAPLGVDVPSRLPAYPAPPTQADAMFQQAQKTAFGQTGSDWPFSPSECSGDQEIANSTRALPAQTKPLADMMPAYTSSSICKLATATVIGSATTQQVDLGPLLIGDVSSTVRLYKDTKRGLVVRSEAQARGIVIKDAAGKELIKIDAARIVGESFAGGTPGTAGTSFERLLCGVHIETPQGPVDVSTCVPPESTVTPTLEQQFGKPPLIQAMNRALGSRGRITIPEPDSELSQGTPGGYLSSVQKDRLQQVSANSVNNDPSSQVPALELVVFNDDPTAGRGRQIYQLAGIDASTTYGINVLDALIDISGGDATDLPLADLLVDMTGGVDTNGGSVLGATLQSKTPAPGFFGAAPLLGSVAGVAKALAFFVRNPRDAGLAAAVWFLLLFPVMLSLRRRLLLRQR